MRVLSVAAAVLPVLLLGQLLPQQWDRQQGRRGWSSPGR